MCCFSLRKRIYQRFKPLCCTESCIQNTHNLTPSKAQIAWHEETEDKVPFIKYLLGTILSAYRDFEDRFALVEKKQPAIEIVRQASMNKLGRFSKQDIRELCPSLSVSAIEGALRKMVDTGEIKREGNGKNTRYRRLG